MLYLNFQDHYFNFDIHVSSQPQMCDKNSRRKWLTVTPGLDQILPIQNF